MITLLALVAATALLTLVAAGDGTLPGDIAVTRWLQRAPVRGLAAAANTGGSTVVLSAVALAVALGLALRRRPAVAGLVVAAAVLRAASTPLKNLIDSPRPTPDVVRVTEQVDSGGFPSGHALGGALLVGVLAWIALGEVRSSWARLGVVVTAVALALAGGVGRVHSGAHWPSDVLGGWLWAALLLVGLRAVARAVAARRT